MRSVPFQTLSLSCLTGVLAFSPLGVDRPATVWAGGGISSAGEVQEEQVWEAPSELFSPETLLEFTLKADFDQLDDDREQEVEERPGTVLWRTPGGEEVSIPMKVQTRGIFRLKKSTCSFPPLRLNFADTAAVGTVFEGQDKIKLVAHCRDRDSYEQNLLEEFLAYRIYNVLTPVGFQVQLARITYVDTSGKDDPVTRLAFLIEDEDAMAERVEGMMLEVASAPAEHFRQDQAGLMYVYQYAIGNTDWSMTHFHNVKVMRIGTDYFPIPYDFDFSGLVDAPYAGPNEAVARAVQREPGGHPRAGSVSALAQWPQPAQRRELSRRLFQLDR
jgi:hypothetical protein